MNFSQLTDSSFNRILDQLAGKFNCFICIDLAKDPVATPCCGQVVCQNCINSWLESNKTCPFCRHQLDKEKLIIISWASNLRRILQLLKQTGSTDHRCEKHNKSYEFYCKTCNVSLCSDCIFDELNIQTSIHKGHQIVKLTHILSSLKMQIQSSLKEVIPKMAIIENSINSIIINNTNLTESKNAVKMEMIESFKKLQNKIDKSLNDYKENLEEAINILSYKKNAVSAYINEIEDILSSPNNIVSFLHNQPKVFLTKVAEIKKPIKDYDNLLVFPSVNELVPSFYDVRVYIPHFKKTVEEYKDLPDDRQNFFYSDKIKINGNIWRVKIYPNGNLNGKGTHLSVFLELFRGCGEPSTYYYKLEIKSLTNDPQLNITRQYTSEFVDTDSWGWNKAALLENIYKGQYLDENDGLVMWLSIKPESYYQVNKDLLHAIQLKKEKYQNLKNMKYKTNSNDHNEMVIVDMSSHNE